jgi:SAM-dependent methyltransferase
MNQETLQKLLAVNAEFYQTFGASFSATRRRIQPGVQRLLKRIPLDWDWLDLGCGNGHLARVLHARGQRGCYLGLDFSRPLLADAPPFAKFLQVDLTEDWLSRLPRQRWDVVSAFAVLHHIPGRALRLRLLQQAAAGLPPGGWLLHSEWQFLNSPRWRKRIQPWGRVGLQAADVAPTITCSIGVTAARGCGTSTTSPPRS